MYVRSKPTAITAFVVSKLTTPLAAAPLSATTNTLSAAATLKPNLCSY